MHHNPVSVKLLFGVHMTCGYFGAIDHGYNGRLHIIRTCSWCVANFGCDGQRVLSQHRGGLGVQGESLSARAFCAVDMIMPGMIIVLPGTPCLSGIAAGEALGDRAVWDGDNFFHGAPAVAVALPIF